MLFCLLLFTLFFSLRLDNTIKWSFWLVFIPIWTWKLTAIVGMIIGSIFWCKLDQQRLRLKCFPKVYSSRVFIFLFYFIHRFERENCVNCKGMMTCFVTNLFLLLFELLVCYNLEDNKILWIVCFVPLLILSIASIGLTIWSIRYSRSYEIELFCAVNILQFIFIALRLDNIILWSWAVST